MKKYLILKVLFFLLICIHPIFSQTLLIPDGYAEETLILYLYNDEGSLKTSDTKPTEIASDSIICFNINLLVNGLFNNQNTTYARENTTIKILIKNLNNEIAYEFTNDIGLDGGVFNKNVLIPKNHYMQVTITKACTWTVSIPGGINYHYASYDFSHTSGSTYQDTIGPSEDGVFQVDGTYVNGYDKDGNTINQVFTPDNFNISCEVLDTAQDVSHYWPSTEGVYSSGIKGYTISVSNTSIVKKFYSKLKEVPIFNGININTGSYTISGYVSDNASHNSDIDSKDVFFDTTGPAAPSSENIFINESSLFEQGILKNIYTTSPIIISSTVPEDSGDIRAGVSSDDGFIELFQNNILLDTYNPNTLIDLSSGVYQASIYFNDKLGNIGNKSNINFNIDNIPPEAPLFKSLAHCFPSSNDSTLIFIPTGTEDIISWLPAMDGTEQWQSGTDEDDYKLRITNPHILQGQTVLSADMNQIQLNDGCFTVKIPQESSGLNESVDYYYIYVTASDKAGNKVESEYTLKVRTLPENIDDIEIIENDGKYYFEWTYNNKGGAEGYCFDIVIRDPSDQIEIWNNSDEILWEEDKTYKIQIPAEFIEQNKLKTKLEYVADIYVDKGAALENIQNHTKISFRLQNILPDLSPDNDFIIPDTGEIFKAGFPSHELIQSKDAEGDLLGLKLYYKKVSESLYKDVDAGFSGSGLPLLSINDETDNIPVLSETGVYDCYLEITEYYYDWDGSLKVWEDFENSSSYLSFERWRSDIRQFAIDNAPPSGTLTAKSGSEESLIDLHASIHDWSGAASSGVSEIIIWNDVNGTGYSSISNNISDVSSDIGYLVEVSDPDGMNITGWPMELIDTLVCTKMIVYDNVGNYSDVISVTGDTDNNPPEVVINQSLLETRVGEIWHCPSEISFYSAIDPDGDELSFFWDFDDGYTSTEAYPTHSYTESGEFTVTLKVSDWWGQSTEVNFILDALNTTSGELLVSETWSGEHILTGVVVVPAGLSLTISEGTLVCTTADTGITVLEGASIEIKGTPTSSAIIGPLFSAEPMPYWNGLLIKGEGNITFTKFSNADRAVAAGPFSTVTIYNCNFTDNRIGLHIVSSSVILSGENSFTGNIWYGIKEDFVTEHPDLNGCLFSENKNDYYHQDLLILHGNELIEYIEN